MQADTSGPSGSTTGASPAYITLVSQEGFKIVLPRSAAIGSKTINSILSDPDWQESRSGVIELPTISTSALETVAEYLIYKERYTRPDLPDNVKIPNFQPRIPVEEALGLLMAADYLEA